MSVHANVAVPARDRLRIERLCPAMPGCVSQGRTEQETLANIKEAIIGCLEERAERGLPLTVRTVEVDVAVA